MAVYINTLDTSSLINYATLSNNLNIPKIIIPNSLNTLHLANIDIPYYDPIPHVSYVTYQDINSDQDLRKKMTDYFYEKVISHLDDSDLFKYVISTDKETRLIKNMKEYENNDRKYSSTKKSFLLEYFMDKDKIKHYLKKYVTKHNINWYDLKKYKSTVVDYILHKIKKDIKHSLATL
jgi:hypothetical protein